MAPSRLVVAWNDTDANPLVRSFAHTAEALYRSSPLPNPVVDVR